MKWYRAEDARPLAEALCAGGLPVAEVTFRTDAGRGIHPDYEKGIPGDACRAGTVTNLDQAARAVEAGAQFIVSPGMSRAVVEYALEKGLAVFPGTCTPTEVMMAMEDPLPGGEVLPGEAVWRP